MCGSALDTMSYKVMSVRSHRRIFFGLLGECLFGSVARNRVCVLQPYVPSQESGRVFRKLSQGCLWMFVGMKTTWNIL